MNTRQYYASFQRQIQHFSDWQLTALATAVTERAWPNFALFAELVEFGEPQELRHCLNMLWDHIAGLQSSKNFERLLERLDDNAPVEHDYDIFGVQPASDFTVSLHCAIECAMKASVDDAASALTLSLSTIGKMIKYAEADELKGVELSQYIEDHELFASHMAFIDELIAMVSNQKAQHKDFAKQLRLLSANEGVSQLGIALD